MAENSYIYRKGATPNTRTAISQKNKVFAFSTGSNGAMDQIGNVASFDLSESRTVDPVRGIGMGDQIAELVPSVTDVMSISTSRAMLYLQNYYQVLGYKGGAEGLVRSLKHHRWPFDIKQELVLSHLVNALSQFADTTSKVTGDDSNAIVTFFEACWINSYSASYPADSAIVNEDLDIAVSDVLDNVTANSVLYDNLTKDNTYTSIQDSRDPKSIRFQG